MSMKTMKTMYNTYTYNTYIANYDDADRSKFIYDHLESILVNSGDLSSGVRGCIKAGAWNRAKKILSSSGAPRPVIVQVINDPEAELTYIVENESNG